jgi:hypothetical protein
VIFHVAGIVARIVLGALAERHIPTRYLLPALGFVTSLATAAAATFDASTQSWWIYAITAALGASGNGWVGLFFAELARLAPTNIASITGGAQFAVYVALVLGPSLYGVMLKFGISHGECLAVFAILALASVLLPVLTALQSRAGNAPR